MTLVNDTTYCYTAFVKTATGPDTYSAGRNVHGRPFATTGPVQWAYTTGATAVTAPGLGPAAVYGVSNDRILHAMVRGVVAPGGAWPTGSPDWTPFLLGAPVQSRPPVVPFAAGPLILLGSQDGIAYAVDAATGLQRWQSNVPLGAEVQAAPAGYFTAFGGTFDLVMVGGRSPGVDNTFYGIDPVTGMVAWQFAGEATDRIGVINGSAAIDYPTARVYFASRERTPGKSTVWCLDFTAAGATLKWKRALGNIDGSPVVRGGVVYVGTNTGVVHALDAVLGTPLWSFPTGNGPVKGFVFPDRSTNDLFFATTARVWGISDDGLSASKNWPEVSAIPSPSIPVHPNASNLVFVGGGDGRLYQLDFTNALPAGPGPVVKSVPLGGGATALGAPTFDSVNNVIYVGSDAGILYAVQLPLP
jgi:outer membrane protein assembly factor BamB